MVTMSKSDVTWIVAVFWLASVGEARSACCSLVRTDADVPSFALRACENDGNDACGAVLFSGPLAVGESRELCATGDTIVYQEWDPAIGSYFGPVTAICAGGDVEI